MCFAPQQRALFRDLNFQKWSEPLVLLTFWLPNVLRATSACTFSTSQLPKVLRPWCVLCILTSKCASRHTGVHFWHRNFQKWSDAEVFCTFWLESVLRATTACTFSTSQLPKVVRQWGVLYVLTSKCASCHNGVHFFHISTSKSRPTMRCFVRFDLEMCFVPQRRALFPHLNFQKSSDTEVFCAFWLGNVQFFISHLASWLRARRFSEPTFRPSGAPNHWKNTVFRDFPTFSRICIFFLLTLLSSNLSLLSASSLLCFSSVHIVGSLTSKLPSMIMYLYYIILYYIILYYIISYYIILYYIILYYIYYI